MFTLRAKLSTLAEINLSLKRKIALIKGWSHHDPSETFVPLIFFTK